MVNTPFDLQKVGSFLDLVFRKKDYVKSFPLVFSQSEGFFVSTHKDNELQSFAALYPINWKVQETIEVKSFCIGSVAVHPSLQGQGLGAATLKQAEERAQEMNAEFVFLFSDVEEFYGKNGYKRAGKEWFIHFSKHSNLVKLDEIARGLSRKNFTSGRTYQHQDTSHLSESEVEEVFEYIIRHSTPAHSLMSRDQFTQLVKIPDMKLLTVRKNDALDCVALFGKGIDFEGTVHCVHYDDVKSCFFLLSELTHRESEPVLFMGELQDEKDFSEFSLYRSPGLFLKVLVKEKEEHYTKLFNQKKIYVRGLQSA